MRYFLLSFILLCLTDRIFASAFQDNIRQAEKTGSTALKKDFYQAALQQWVPSEGLSGRIQAYFGLSQTCFNLGLYAEAASHCREILILDSQHQGAWLLQGKSQGHLALWQQSRQSFTSLLRINSALTNQVSLYYYYLSFSFRSDPADYQYLLEESLRYQPFFIEALSRLVSHYLDQGLTDKANKLALSLQQQKPQDPAGWFVMGLVKEQEGDLTSAVHYYRKALDSRAEIPVYEAWIRTLNFTGRGMEARDDLQQHIRQLQSDWNTSRDYREKERLAQEQARFLALLSLVFLEQNDFSRAWENARLAWKFSPDRNDYRILSQYLNAGMWMCRQKVHLGDLKGALRILKDVALRQSDNLSLLKATGYWELNSLIRLLERRISLGRIEPENMHRILSLVLRDTEAVYTNSAGEVITLSAKSTDYLYGRIGPSVSFSKMLIESLTRGKLTLEHFSQPADATLRQVQSQGEWIKVTGQDLDSITPPLLEVLNGRLNQFDTLAVWWPGSPAVKSQPNSSLSAPVLLPWTLYGPTRGSIILPLESLRGSGARDILVHEFFHVMEDTAGIHPRHGYIPALRENFPGFSGTNAWEYYDWQIGHTIQEYGWKNLEWSQRDHWHMDSTDLTEWKLAYLKLDPSRVRQAWLDYRKMQFTGQADKINQLKKIVLIHPLYPQAWTDLAWGLYQSGSYRQAYTAVTQLIRLLPEDRQVHLLAARICVRLKKWDELGQHLQKSASSQEQSSEHVRQLEGYFWGLETLQDKRKLAGVLQQAAPGYYMPWYYQAYLDFREGEYRSAWEHCEKSLVLYPWDPDVYFLQARILDQMGRYDEAVLRMDYAITRNPALGTKAAEHYYFLAGRLTDPGLRLRFYSAAVSRDPGYATAWYKRAWTSYDLGQTVSAIADFKRAADLGLPEATGSLQRYFKIKYRAAAPIKVQYQYRVALLENDYTASLGRILEGHRGRIYYQIINADFLRKNTLQDYDALVVGGGMTAEYFRLLTPQAVSNIRGFVHSGGIYLGIGAGAYLGLQHPDFLGIIDARPRFIHNWYRGSGTVFLTMTESGSRLYAAEEVPLRYMNGPLFEPAGKTNLPPYQVLAVFRSEVCQGSAPQGQMPQSPAIITAPYGQGRVLLFSPHPEYSPGWQEMLIQSLDWLFLSNP